MSLASQAIRTTLLRLGTGLQKTSDAKTAIQINIIMKRLFSLFVTSLLLTATGYSQGVFINTNRDIARGLDAPVYQSDGQTPLDGAYVAQVWAGATIASISPISAPAPFRDGEGVGYWKADLSERIDGIAVPGVASGESAFVQIYVWAITHGDLGSAIANGSENSWAFSDIFSAATGSPPANLPPAIPASPTAMIGLTSFSMTTAPTATALGLVDDLPDSLADLIAANAIPEPASIALGAFGILMLVGRARGRRHLKSSV